MIEAKEIALLLPGLLAEARRLTRNSADANDLLQDTAEKALRNRASQSVDPKGWLYSILKTTWLTRLQRRVKRDKLFHAYYVPYLFDNIDLDATEAVEMRDLRAKLAAMPRKLRTPLWLHEIGGLDYEEISLVLNLPKGTVKSRISRARDLL